MSLMRRPAGFDARPILQHVIILAQFRVALRRQAAKTQNKAILELNKSSVSVVPGENT